MNLIAHRFLINLFDIYTNIRVNKVLVDVGDVVNLMPQSLLKKIGKCGTDLKPHNIVLSNYEEKVGFSLGSK